MPPQTWPNDIKEPVHFSNGQWAVTDYGLECLRSYYPIDAKRMAEVRDDVYEWPVHLAEKSWVDMAQFMEAFEHALRRHAAQAFDAALLRTSEVAARADRQRDGIPWKGV